MAHLLSHDLITHILSFLQPRTSYLAIDKTIRKYIRKSLKTLQNQFFKRFIYIFHTNKFHFSSSIKKQLLTIHLGPKRRFIIHSFPVHISLNRLHISHTHFYNIRHIPYISLLHILTLLHPLLPTHKLSFHTHSLSYYSLSYYSR